MVDQKIIKYIQEMITKGYSKEQIKGQLTKYNYSSIDIEEAFNIINNTTVNKDLDEKRIIFWMYFFPWIGALLLMRYYKKINENASFFGFILDTLFWFFRPSVLLKYLNPIRDRRNLLYHILQATMYVNIIGLIFVTGLLFSLSYGIGLFTMTSPLSINPLEIISTIFKAFMVFLLDSIFIGLLIVISFIVAKKASKNQDFKLPLIGNIAMRNSSNTENFVLLYRKIMILFPIIIFLVIFIGVGFRVFSALQNTFEVLPNGSIEIKYSEPSQETNKDCFDITDLNKRLSCLGRYLPPILLQRFPECKVYSDYEDIEKILSMNSTYKLGFVYCSVNNAIDNRDIGYCEELAQYDEYAASACYSRLSEAFSIDYCDKIKLDKGLKNELGAYRLSYVDIIECKNDVYQYFPEENWTYIAPKNISLDAKKDFSKNSHDYYCIDEDESFEKDVNDFGKYSKSVVYYSNLLSNGEKTKTDYCVGNTLTEYYCDDGAIYDMSIPCQEGCVEGSCV